jgi:hypothetical protein
MTPIISEQQKRKTIPRDPGKKSMANAGRN